ncbi:GntR family transcriptional regulator [Microbacterium sp. X-17]|uniref:GntR family transcriptional regulator n=1 Tax=Microbacterium sp. X-17 TaxID=3144404 RepID=UPI0031F59C74
MTDRDNLKEQAFVFLRDAIISGQLEDQSLNSVYRLADLLDMSRTPVREAVLQLAEAGMVTIERNRGVRIHGLNTQKIRDIFELRLLLEVPAASYVARFGSAVLHAELQQANVAAGAALAVGDQKGFLANDRAFHDRLVVGVGNHQFKLALDGARDVVLAPRLDDPFGGRSPEDVVKEHALIASAIAARDPERAASSMRDHLQRTGTIMLRDLSLRTSETFDANWADRLG